MDHTTTVDTRWQSDARDHLRTMRWLTTAGIIIAISVLLLGVTVMLQARADAWRQAEQSSDNLVLTLDREIVRNIGTYDLSLQGAADVLKEPGLDQLSPALRRAAIFDRAASAEYLGMMLVTSASGVITANSTTERVEQANLSDRDYFTAQRDDPNLGVYLSKPFRSRLRAGAPTIVLSRGLIGSNGEFDGIVLGALNVSYFDHLFEKLNVGKDGIVSLIRADGHMIARLPYDPSNFDRDISSSETFRKLITAQSGHYVGDAAVDGVRRLYTFRRVGGLPLLLSVGLSVSEINAAWLTRSAITGGMLAGLCLASLTLSILFRREMVRRLKAENMLAERATVMAELATKDGLTGLGNRRAFEEDLTRTWRHTLRSRGSLALLMLDADCFKSYNDQYGHPAGDQVLRAIGFSIQSGMRRPLDLAFRYGGEEFVVLLPDSSLEGATIVAESVRHAVAALRIPHDGSPSRMVTISVGVAATRVVERSSERLLLEAADEALYQSKRRGRNCVTASNVVNLTAVPALTKEAAQIVA